MKKQSTLLFTAVAALAISFTSCKKDSTNVENGSSDTIVTTEPDNTMVEPDTVQAPPVNDSNAAGTTSGEMQQVP